MALFLLTPLLGIALVLMSRRYVTQQYAANYLGVTVRTIRNKISEGLITGYRLPGMRAVRVDLDEIESKLQVIPAALRRAGRPPFGPKAKIVDIVEAQPPQAEGNGKAGSQDQ